MIIAIGCDHAGFEVKDGLIDEIAGLEHDVVDCGAYSNESVDYPDFAKKVGLEIRNGNAERGILICGSGIGVSVAANKVPGIRAAVCHDTYSARQGVEHDAMNVLCLGSRVVGRDLITDLVRAFLSAEFTPKERYERRLNKVQEIEETMCRDVYGVEVSD